MEIDQSKSWLPPDTSWLRFNDCEVVSDWALGFFTSGDLPVEATILLMHDGLGEFWRANSIPTPDNFTELIPWAVQHGDPVYIETLNYTNSNCQTQFCRKLPWEGNADLAGRGMVVNYCIQAALVTIYMAFHMAVRFGWSPASGTKAHRILAAVQESTRPFLDNSLLFSVAVHIAALFTFIRGRVDTDSPTPTTAAVFSAFIAIYTIFPPLVLHSCAAKHLRRKRERMWIWMFIGALKLTVYGLYYGDPDSPWLRKWQDWNSIDTYRAGNNTGLYGLMQNDKNHQLKWESFCVTELGADRANWAITVSSVVVSTVVVLSLVFVANIFRRPFLADERRPWLRKLRRHRWVVAAFLAFLAMWVSLGIFFWFRAELNKHAGQLNKDSEWTFGQILAVTNWAPVLVEFVVLWRDGAKKGLAGQMSDRFAVVEKDQLEEKPAEWHGDGDGDSNSVEIAQSSSA